MIVPVGLYGLGCSLCRLICRIAEPMKAAATSSNAMQIAMRECPSPGRSGNGLKCSIAMLAAMQRTVSRGGGAVTAARRVVRSLCERAEVQDGVPVATGGTCVELLFDQRVRQARPALAIRVDD